MYPSSTAAPTMLSILRPVTATLRPCWALMLMICCTRCTLEEKVAMTIRLSGLAVKIYSSDLPTFFSEGVKPGRSALVDSQRSSSTPSRPSCPRRVRSIISPWMGVMSSLKSPVCTTVPSGVWMARQQASAIEWLTWMNSTVSAPARTLSPALTVRRSGFQGSECSSSLFLTIPMVSRVP